MHTATYQLWCAMPCVLERNVTKPSKATPRTEDRMKRLGKVNDDQKLQKAGADIGGSGGIKAAPVDLPAKGAISAAEPLLHILSPRGLTSSGRRPRQAAALTTSEVPESAPAGIACRSPARQNFTRPTLTGQSCM